MPKASASKGDRSWKKFKGRSSVLPVNPLKESPALMQEERHIPKSYQNPNPHLACLSTCTQRKYKRQQCQGGWAQPTTKSNYKEPSWGGAWWTRTSLLLNWLPLLGEGQGYCKSWPRWHIWCALAWARWTSCRWPGLVWKWLKRLVWG